MRLFPEPNRSRVQVYMVDLVGRGGKHSHIRYLVPTYRTELRLCSAAVLGKKTTCLHFRYRNGCDKSSPISILNAFIYAGVWTLLFADISYQLRTIVSYHMVWVLRISLQIFSRDLAFNNHKLWGIRCRCEVVYGLHGGKGWKIIYVRCVFFYS